MPTAMEVVGAAAAAFQEDAERGDPNFSTMAKYYAPDAPHKLQVAGESIPEVVTHGFAAVARVLWKEATEIPGYQVVSFDMREGVEGDDADVVVDMGVKTDAGESKDTLYLSVEDGKIVASRHLFGSPELAGLLM